MGACLGWVDTLRTQKKFCFIELRNAYDGIQCRLQVVVPADGVPIDLSQEAYVKVTGTVTQLPAGM